MDGWVLLKTYSVVMFGNIGVNVIFRGLRISFGGLIMILFWVEIWSFYPLSLRMVRFLYHNPFKV